MNRITKVALAAGLIGILGTLAAACGGSDDPKLGTYLKNAQQVDQQHEAIAQPLRDNLDALSANLGPDDKIPADVADTFGKLIQQEDDFANAITKVKPAKEVKAIQTEAVAALRAEAAYGRTVVGSIKPETTLAEIGAAMESDESKALQDRRHNACLAIQKLADDNHVAVDMTC